MNSVHSIRKMQNGTISNSLTSISDIRQKIYQKNQLPTVFSVAKNRIHELQALKELLETNALTCNFIIPETAKEGISYAEYLKQLSLSRCVIDINQSNQTGLTRRPLEALFYNKKLITNNADIRRHNFYNPKNIFIFGIDSTEFLKEFVKSPVDKIPEQIRQQYDINTWIDQYLP